jgi:hypothetical protein
MARKRGGKRCQRTSQRTHVSPPSQTMMTKLHIFATIALAASSAAFQLSDQTPIKRNDFLATATTGALATTLVLTPTSPAQARGRASLEYSYDKYVPRINEGGSFTNLSSTGPSLRVIGRPSRQQRPNHQRNQKKIVPCKMEGLPNVLLKRVGSLIVEF